MTQLQSGIGLSAFVLCAVLLVHAVAARRPKNQADAVRPRVITILVGLPLIFGAAWLWLSFILPLVAWMAWIGDNPHWFYEWSRPIATIPAGVLTFVVALRVLTRTARPGYARAQCAGAAALILLFAAAALGGFVNTSQGTDPETAAKRVLHRIYPFLATTAQELKEESRTSTCITYVASDGVEPKARITVCRYRRWWWKVGATVLLVPHPNVWESIEEAQERHPDHAELLLRNVIKHYPNSQSSRRAERALRELSSTSRGEE